MSIDPDGLLSFFRSYAILQHGTQMYGSFPYSVHLDAVAANVSRFGGDFTALERCTLRTAAIGHDLIEDCDVTKENLLTVLELYKAGPEVVEIIDLVTDVPGKNRRERTEKTWPRIRTNSRAVFVKLCDRIANTEASLKNNPSLLEMYKKEFPAFKQALYLEGEHQETWSYLENLIFDES